MLDDLLLLRLLCARLTDAGSETFSQTSKDLFPLAGDPKEPESRWRETLAAGLDRLAQAGDLTREGRKGARLRITPAGERRAREVFGVPADHRPKTAGWSHWWNTFGLSKALDGKLPADAEALRATMLLRFYLPEVDPAMTHRLREVADLLLTRKIGAKATPATLRAAAVRAWARGAEGETAVGHDAAKQETTPPAPPVERTALPADDGAFVRLVRDTARHTAAARAGGGKVFISHVWRMLTQDGDISPDEERAFKDRLTQANTAGTLRLVHSDLAEPREADDVAASETRFLSERFHYIQLD